MRTLAVTGFALLSLALAQPVHAAAEYDRDAALAASQGAIGEPLKDFVFRDTEGQAVRLQSMTGKPLVISMIYTSCHHICPTITQNLQEKVAIAAEAFGDDQFTVVTIGFDWRVDTAEQMRIYASSRGIDQDNWHFLSGDSHSVDSISENLGFQFFASAKGFDHLSQTTIVDADGIIYRQVYGEDFTTQQFVEPIKELVFNTPRSAGVIEHWVDTFRFFCTVYDPNSGRYQFDYSILMTIFVGVMCLGAVFTFIVREWRRSV